MKKKVENISRKSTQENEKIDNLLEFFQLTLCIINISSNSFARGIDNLDK